MTNKSEPHPEQPERLDLRSHDAVAGRLQELLRLFPEVRTEDGKLDFERLKLALGTAVDVGPERFGMNWPGKADCFKAIQTPSMATLRPCPEESVRFDSTENLIIEGDNLEVLKLLQKAYQGKVKMIYIDPPYNTGKDFIYPDNYSESLQTYLAYTGQVDAEGKKFGTNAESEGRFHSRWMCMMYPRIFLARNLLREDGLLFISISDIETPQLRRICDEILGEDCFVAQFVWNNEGNIDNQSKVKVAHEYILCYARSQEKFERPAVIDPNIEESSKLYNDQIENSITKNGPANPPSIVLLPVGFPASLPEFSVESQHDRWPKVHDNIIVKDGLLSQPARVESGWSSRNLLDLFISNGCVPILDAEGKETWFAITQTGAIYGYKRRASNQGHVLSVIRNVGTTKQSSSMLAKWGIEFSYPKPVRLIRYLLEIATSNDPDALVLDFFPGSGTTAHAVHSLNEADNGRRTYILVQLPEMLEVADPAPAGRSDTVFDLCVSRVRHVINEIEESNSGMLRLGDTAPPDRGFRVFKLAESNFTPWDSAVPHDEKTLQNLLDTHVEHIREGRSDADLLYEILLKSGFPLDAKVETLTLAGHTVHAIAGGSFLICLERDLDLELIRAIADRKPERVVCLDRGFAGNDALKTNAVQIFKAKGVKKFLTL